MMKLLALFISLIAVPVLASEFYDWLPCIARWLIRQAARILPAEARERHAAQWAAELDALPGGKLTKLACAVRVFIKAPRTTAVLRRVPPDQRATMNSTGNGIYERRCVPDLATGSAHPARMYDYWLGGCDNYLVDRFAADQVIAVIPEVRDMARENRAFLGRAVRHLTKHGIRQFLDIGAGIPGPGNTGDVAYEITPDARIVYVDNDPVVIAHANALLAGHDPLRSGAVQADLRDPDAILGHPVTNAVLDFTKPIGILLIGVLHFIMDDEDPVGLVEQLKKVMAPGSYLVVSHGTSDIDPERAAQAVRTYNQGGARIIARTGAQIRQYFEGLELLDPGVVQLPLWRPDGEVPDDISRIWWYGGVARKK